MTNNNDQNNENEFPGYPHYPAKEDIMNSKDVARVNLDVEDISRSKLAATGSGSKPGKPFQAEKAGGVAEDEDDELEESKETDDTDITRDDLFALGEDESTLGPIEQITGSDLDVPGTEEDDANEEIGEEDEENNYYSLGGDTHENLGEDKGGEG